MPAVPRRGRAIIVLKESSMPYPQLDRHRLNVKPLSQRKNKVFIERDHNPADGGAPALLGRPNGTRGRGGGPAPEGPRGRQIPYAVLRRAHHQERVVAGDDRTNGTGLVHAPGHERRPGSSTTGNSRSRDAAAKTCARTRPRASSACGKKPATTSTWPSWSAPTRAWATVRPSASPPLRRSRPIAPALRASRSWPRRSPPNRSLAGCP